MLAKRLCISLFHFSIINQLAKHKNVYKNNAKVVVLFCAISCSEELALDFILFFNELSLFLEKIRNALFDP